MLTLILHLSDLHLASVEGDELIGDHKRSVLRSSDRARRTLRIQSSLRALGRAMIADSCRLDAVVISGDITDRGSPDGFSLLERTLNELDEALPPRDQIMIVPGNHDVQWFTEPSSIDRYQHFIEGVRKRGFRTPLLEGIDTDRDGSLRPDAVDPVMMIADGRIAILGLNTTDYCGVNEVPSDDVSVAIADLDSRMVDDSAWRMVRNDWRKRGAFDVARLGAVQRRWGAQKLVTAINRTPGAVVRVAVMHHQLLPVGTDEEVKPFESLLNLGQAREFFAENDIDVLLHGHKHTAALYKDRYRAGEPSREHSMVVCSARTVGKGQTSGGEVAKLLEVDTGLPTVVRISVRSIPARDEGGVLRIRQISPMEVFTVRGGDPLNGKFNGATAAEVHEKLVDAFRDDTATVGRPVVCRVEDGMSALAIPETYPPIPGHEGEQRQAWFTEMAAHWQRPVPGRAMEFNHGQRLRRHWPGVDQIARVIDVLSARSESSRALTILA
jgi:3',5'-cyclic AMP phosphodiesterase CpdA